MPKVDLITEFRNDHRFVVRNLVTLQKLEGNGDLPKAREIIEALDKATGPHFKFEEEALYPALERFLGEKRVSQFVRDHEGAVQVVRRLRELFSKGKLSKEELAEAKENLTAFFAHASDCDGLNILAEQLSEEERAELADKLIAYREWGVPLTEWKK